MDKRTKSFSYGSGLVGQAANLKFLEKLKLYRSHCELPKLINIGSCGLHITQGAFNSGTEATS